MLIYEEQFDAQLFRKIQWTAKQATERENQSRAKI